LQQEMVGAQQQERPEQETQSTDRWRSPTGPGDDRTWPKHENNWAEAQYGLVTSSPKENRSEQGVWPANEELERTGKIIGRGIKQWLGAENRAGMKNPGALDTKKTKDPAAALLSRRPKKAVPGAYAARTEDGNTLLFEEKENGHLDLVAHRDEEPERH
jgi:hypothetical protein